MLFARWAFNLNFNATRHRLFFQLNQGENMKSKIKLFYLPTIILLIYVIVYYPLLSYLLDVLVNPSASPEAMVSAFEVNNIMNKIIKSS